MVSVIEIVLSFPVLEPDDDETGKNHVQRFIFSALGLRELN